MRRYWKLFSLLIFVLFVGHLFFINYNYKNFPVISEDEELLRRREYYQREHLIVTLVIACNRVSVTRPLSQLLKLRPDAGKFPIVVSLDCAHKPTQDAISHFVDRGEVTLIKQPDQSPIALDVKKNLRGYYNIARHYLWALDQIFLEQNYFTAIIVEDDISIATDFFQYFQGTHFILKEDTSLWCVSAWNDNGFSNLTADLPEKIYRTDFFPGLGWMLIRDTWLELRKNWPAAYWDDHLRKEHVRRGRQCLRPEISRTNTFGSRGVSGGQFYHSYLKRVVLNTKFVNFTQLNLDYLFERPYSTMHQHLVYVQSRLFLSFEEFLIHYPNLLMKKQSVRLEYRNMQDFKILAKKIGIMNDDKDGVPRTAYKGVVSIFYKGVRTYLAPKLPWSGYVRGLHG